jgi:hypothetical protein
MYIEDVAGDSLTSRFFSRAREHARGEEGTRRSAVS